jgi:hypothetical protein
VEIFHGTTRTPLRHTPLEKVLGWLQQDMDYVRSSAVPQDGIGIIKAENNIDVFDMALIDGSAFTGRAELQQVYGSHLIILDDINDIKNYENFQRLKGDSRYKLIVANRILRNGYALFHRVA